MSPLELCERIQAAWLSRAIGESTWGYPIVGALHVLALALFGGAMLIPQFREEVRWIRRIGLTLVVLTGILLFSAGAARYYESTSFRIKMALLALIVVETITFSGSRSKRHSAITLALWAAVIFAARGIAFF
jgi:hypothetical protein